MLPLVTIIGLGCSEPDWVTTVGTLNAAGDRSVSLTKPTDVTATSRFDVTVQTFGSSNCTRAERLDMTVGGNLARLAPFDQVPASGQTSCFRDLAPLAHSGTVAFGTAGPATLRVVGYFGQGDQAVLDSVDLAVDVGP
ncbi:MAG TPA: hypothetical protein VFN08_10100 [Gemmatimonadales bacterium]|jgi:hypothetical protein|nr:hypothetical protein [Gemmatimonadales bacterium]